MAPICQSPFPLPPCPIPIRFDSIPFRFLSLLLLCPLNLRHKTQSGKQTNKQTGKQAGKSTHRQTNKQTKPKGKHFYKVADDEANEKGIPLPLPNLHMFCNWRPQTGYLRLASMAGREVGGEICWVLEHMFADILCKLLPCSGRTRGGRGLRKPKANPEFGMRYAMIWCGYFNWTGLSWTRYICVCVWVWAPKLPLYLHMAEVSKMVGGGRECGRK